jgi:phosphoribosylaminoimidazolecarboxamide formyltransferase/IMP cyclohydrolase
MATIQRALLSVTDKTGIVEFARGLAEFGIELISTGGTFRTLAQAGIPVREVADITGFPEMLDGRVKTIHPRIAGGILAIRSNAGHMRAIEEHAIPRIDLVVVNLYQFEKTAAKEGATVPELIENIDIGGPAMIRAAAKNYQDVAVVVSPEDYAPILHELRTAGSLSLNTQWELAKKAYATTAKYDRAISTRLERITIEEGQFRDATSIVPRVLDIHAEQSLPLRYGENPHQYAGLYSLRRGGVADCRQLHGKELSYNNLVDLDAAWQLIQEFDGPASAVIKHTNPCGCAEHDVLAESYRRAFEADPVSAFGGVLAFNRALDAATAHEVAKTFIEAIAAPGFSAEAIEILGAKKNLRLVRVAPLEGDDLVVKSISGGFLAQTADTHRFTREQGIVKTKRTPSDDEWRAMLFGWKVVKHVKSNAIVYSRPGQLISTGAGQMSRVDSVKVAAMKAILPLAGTVMASDAFFPFPDGVEEAARQGITAVIQPGGSVRDNEVVEAADRLGLAMVFTSIRHFRH